MGRGVKEFYCKDCEDSNPENFYSHCKNLCKGCKKQKSLDWYSKNKPINEIRIKDPEDFKKKLKDKFIKTYKLSLQNQAETIRNIILSEDKSADKISKILGTVFEESKVSFDKIFDE
jgi:hypothetical protein